MGTPDDWTPHRIGEFLRESRVPGSTGERAKKITVRLYGKGAIEKNDVRLGSAATRYYRRKSGQFVYSKLDFLNGAFAILPPSLDGYETTLDLPAFDIDSGLDPAWFLAYVTRPEFYRSFFHAAKGSRKARRVNPEEFLATTIPLPPLGEQRKIAAILSSVDETIEKTEAVIDQLQVVKKAMMQELLTRGMPGRHTRFKQTEIGEIPESWELVFLRELVVEGGLQTGPFGSQIKASEYVESGVPLVMPRNLKDARIDSSDIARIPEEVAKERLAIHLLEAGDIVFSRRGDIGRCALVTDAEVGWVCGTGCLRARMNDRVVPEFLIHQLSEDRVVDWLVDMAVGQTMLNLNASILASLPLVLPPVAEQEEIASQINSIVTRIRIEMHVLAALNELKAGLAPMLLSGDIRTVPGDARS